METTRNGFLYEARQETHFDKAIHLVWASVKVSGRTTLELYLMQGLELPATRQLNMNAPPQSNHVQQAHNLDPALVELVYASARGTESDPEFVSDTESYKLCWLLEARGCNVLSYTQTQDGNRLIHASPDIKEKIQPFLTRR